jgi:hypothetical protein
MGVISTQGFIFRLLAGENPKTQLDLFKDEDIKLSNNVTGLFDIGVLPADFTRQITVPGSKVNNAFFEHVYDISITNPFLFATNIKVPCYFDFGGFYLSNGYLQLNKVNVLANKFIESYEITVFGTLSSFGRDINKNFLTDLTSLSAYNHTSSMENITGSWSGSLFGGKIVYPMAEYGQQISYTPEETNFGIDSPYGGLCVQDYKPSIRVKTVLDAIFQEAGYTYSSSFLSQAWIDNVYMICNNALKYPEYSSVDPETYGLFKIGPISGSNMTNVTMSAGTDLQLPWFNVLTNPGGQFDPATGALNTQYGTGLRGTINLNFNISSSASQVPVFALRIKDATGTTISNQRLGVINDYLEQVRLYNNGATRPQTIETSQQFNSGYLPSGSYKFYLEYENCCSAAPVQVVLDPNNSIKSYFEVTKATSIGDGLVMNIPLNMPYGTSGIKQIDFILGLQKKFNLVIYPNNTKLNEFIIETFNNWYKKGQVKDFNKYINLDERIEVIPANNFAVNKLNFGDTLDGDYISQQFSKQANREYGKQYYIDTTNYYSQGSFDVKTTFASSPLIRIAGTGLSGSVGGINPPVTQYSAGTQRFTGASDSRVVCTSGTEIEMFTADGMITQGQIAYYDQYAAIPIRGYRYFTYGGGNEIYEINKFTGEIGYGTGDFC